MQVKRLQIPDCPPKAVATLRGELRLSQALAEALVRRGHSEPQRAQAFLDASERHPPSAFNGIARAVELVQAHIVNQRKITVHGDYDVDGICATALLVRALKRLGAQVDWHIPRRQEGYGLSLQTVQALAHRGTSLLITVDCGICSLQEVALARSLGIDVIVTDHHAQSADGALPDAVIVHPRICHYPCAELCGAAVAYKLAAAISDAAGRQASELEADLDLVGLATIADVVPLVGENRTLAKRGLAALARTVKPGLRALMAVAGVDQSHIGERAVAFALAPRLNAAGRLYDAATALELLLTSERQRAISLAEELDRCNRERKQTQLTIEIEAEAQARAVSTLAGYVLAGEGWNPGVVGIVAARIAERHNKPVVLVALDGDTGRGSGRSIPAFDLLNGLRACEGHLLRYGGHAAAAGLQLQRDRLEGFQQAFAQHAAVALDGCDARPSERVDAILDLRKVGIDLAEELRRLAPFGHGNPPVSLLLEGAQLRQLRAIGEGKHARFQVHRDGVHASGVAFGVDGGLHELADEPFDATFALEVNEWRGVSEPRLVLRSLASEIEPQRARVPSENALFRPAHAPVGSSAHARRRTPPHAAGSAANAGQSLQMALPVP